MSRFRFAKHFSQYPQPIDVMFIRIPQHPHPRILFASFRESTPTLPPSLFTLQHSGSNYGHGLLPLASSSRELGPRLQGGQTGGFPATGLRTRTQMSMSPPMWRPTFYVSLSHFFCIALMYCVLSTRTNNTMYIDFDHASTSSTSTRETPPCYPHVSSESFRQIYSLQRRCYHIPSRHLFMSQFRLLSLTRRLPSVELQPHPIVVRPQNAMPTPDHIFEYFWVQLGSGNAVLGVEKIYPAPYASSVASNSRTINPAWTLQLPVGVRLDAFLNDFNKEILQRLKNF